MSRSAGLLGFNDSVGQSVCSLTLLQLNDSSEMNRQQHHGCILCLAPLCSLAISLRIAAGEWFVSKSGNKSTF